MPVLCSMSEVMAALGGGDPAAGRKKLIEVTRSSTQHVTNWLSEGRFPSWSWLVISTALAQVGHSMEPAVCGLMPLGARKSPRKIARKSGRKAPKKSAVS